jgi:CarboxypepD_reg-like domain
VKKSHLLCLVLILLLAGASQRSFAQKQKRVIQLSGVVMSTDTTNSMLFGVNIYVPKAGRGTTTNTLGFFSMPVLAGDSIVISYVGFERQYYIVPDHKSEYLTVVIQLKEDATYLTEVIVTPFPTEEVFKEALLALNIPTEDQNIDRKNINQELLLLMLKTTPMDGRANQQYYLSQMSAAQGSQYMPVTNPLFNVFNWAKFFRSLKQNKK